MTHTQTQLSVLCLEPCKLIQIKYKIKALSIQVLLFLFLFFLQHQIIFNFIWI